jgi:hypothetical protein
MEMTGPGPTALLALWAFSAPALHAQVTATIDAGISNVHYDGFLPSGAASFSPAIVFEHRRSTLSAHGTFLLFQSGNTNVQGGAAASAFVAAKGRWRGELWATAGASQYANIASFWHALGGARVHFLGREGTGWVDVNLGRASFGVGPRPVLALAGGWWTRRQWLLLTLSAAHTRVGDTLYTDVGTLARARARRLEVEAALAARLWSRGAGQGVFGEASARFVVSDRLSIVVAGGRYPTDPVRGSVAGRYVSAALRVRATVPRARNQPSPPPASTEPVFTARGSHSASGGVAATASLEVAVGEAGNARLIIHAPDVRSVEIIGDFTDWQPVALTRTGPSVWEVALPIRPGVHRLNVRLSQGAWLVPSGTTPVVDDFGGETGQFVVP